jgi:hypothetical protein
MFNAPNGKAGRVEAAFSWEDLLMNRYTKLVSYFSGTVATALLGAAALTPAAAQVCQGPGAPATAQTRCIAAMTTGHPLTAYDISWVNPDRAEYYLSDRSTAGIDVFDTQHLKFKRTIGGFVGVQFANGAPNNNISGPDGVVSHGRWLYAGDGNSSLKVIDLDNPTTPIQQILFTVSPAGKAGTTRVDEMALTTDGKLLLAANNAEDPPYATLFAANGDNRTSNVKPIIAIGVDPAIIPPNSGLSLEQAAWDPTTQRFYTSIPTIANNPAGCVLGSKTTPCSGGLLVTDPLNPKATETFFSTTTGTGVIPLTGCGPNGATVGVHDNLLLGCTPGNLPGDTITLVVNGKTHNTANVNGITGSDEVFFNSGDNRYYLGASAAVKAAGSTLGSGAVLGVVDETSVLVESIPQSSGSHSVAADSKRNLIFVPQTYTAPVGTLPAPDVNFTAGAGSPTVGQLICGSSIGCIAVYRHDVDEDDDDGHEGHDHDR